MDDNYLPVFGKKENVISSGRNLYEGYQRGWGLKYGDLKPKVLEDPVFKEAYSLIKDISIMNFNRLINLFLIMKFYLGKISFGHIIEFGSYRGGSAVFMASIAKKLYPGMRIYALDTWKGMPVTDGARDLHNAGDFSDVRYEDMLEFKKKVGLENIEFVKGLFENTAGKVLSEAKNIALAHIDCDIYSAVGYSYDVVKKHIVNGGYVVFDDATEPSCLGATEAVEKLVIQKDGLNSEQIYPHYVFRLFK